MRRSLHTTPKEDRGAGVLGALNHLGVEVEQPQDVQAALARFQTEGVAVTEEMDTNCCYAQQDKVWVHDPAGTPWEIYVITNDIPDTIGEVEFVGKMNDGACCTPDSQAHTVPTGPTPATSATCC